MDIIRDVILSGKGNLINTIVNDFDDQNRIIKSVSIYSSKFKNHYVNTLTIFKYGEFGETFRAKYELQESERLHSYSLEYYALFEADNDKGKLLESVKNEYDDNGNLVKVKTFSDGETTVKNYYPGENGYYKLIITKSEDNTKSVIDALGDKIIKECFYEEDSKSTKILRSESYYDDPKKRLTKHKDIYYQGSKIIENTEEYKYYNTEDDSHEMISSDPSLSYKLTIERNDDGSYIKKKEYENKKCYIYEYYNKEDKLIKETSELLYGNVTEKSTSDFLYDDNGNLIYSKVKNDELPDGQFQLSEVINKYNDDNKLMYSLDSNGKILMYFYDKGNQTKVITIFDNNKEFFNKIKNQSNIIYLISKSDGIIKNRR